MVATVSPAGKLKTTRGTHDELLAKEGKYYELWNMQQGIYRSKKAEPKQSVMQAVVEEDDDGESITY